MATQVILFMSVIACVFGDIMNIDTTGASVKTAHQEKLQVTGVEASYILAEKDLKRMDQYKSTIMKVCQAKQMDPAVIAGIISKESKAGAGLAKGWGNQGNAFGLMQIDKDCHTPKGAWDSETHITQATEILIEFIKAIQAKFPTWSKDQQLKGGISAYNAGDGNVCTYKDMDEGTTGDDYANDVVARAKYYKQHGYN